MAGERDRGRHERVRDEYDEIVVSVRRCAKVVKGGKRFSFSALVVVGNRKGKVGWGIGKAKEVPFAVEKAIKEAKKRLIVVPLKDTTIPHTILAKHCASQVLLRPASKGTGTIAGASARAVLELAGVRDILSKVFGSANPLNVVKATYEGLGQLRSKKAIEDMRGIRLAQQKTA
jgi:small subunit ribosomal protein S5